MTIGEALKRSGLAALDAQILLTHVLGKNSAWLIAHDNDPLMDADASTFQSLCQRRKDGEPIAYITGTREFWSMELNVTPDTLIPRPETELLVEQILTKIPPKIPCSILDLGTGTGAIALAIASERPNAQITATDISDNALSVARSNMDKFSINNIKLVQGAWYEAVEDQQFDCVVSNPPYVAEGDPHLADLEHEPEIALTPGGDGLGAYRQIIAGLSSHLREGGWVALEHGHDQQPQLLQMLTDASLSNISGINDLSGIPRLMMAQR